MPKVGFGYDSHRFVSGRPLMLGGLRIDHDRGLAGHSDADAVLHAITDAILGAMAAGDIGQLFPDTDRRWADAESAVFVRRAVQIARRAGLAVGNCDVTVIAESPKLAPFAVRIRSSIAELLGVDPAVVSVKAKTNEGMGPIGRGEGLTAIAVVMLVEDERPAESD